MGEGGTSLKICSSLVDLFQKCGKVILCLELSDPLQKFWPDLCNFIPNSVNIKCRREP